MTDFDQLTYKMKDKLELMFKFLEANRTYNLEMQERYYQRSLLSKSTPFDKLISLLYAVFETQSQPRINLVSKFFQKVYKDAINKRDINFEEFLKLLKKFEKNKNVEVRENNYSTLFNLLRNCPGWGDKTSALFTKSLYQIHYKVKDQNLKIWNDIPKLQDGDQLYVPVDAVILFIFGHIEKDTKWNFNKINKVISHHYKGENIEVWDDLWFWGFITQRSDKNGRYLEWNVEKYWSQSESEKNSDYIKVIEEKAQLFMRILETTRSKPS